MAMKILHVVPGLENPANGIAVAAKLVARRQDAKLVDARAFSRDMLAGVGEVWVHSMWTPSVMVACRKVLKAGVPLVRMPHGCLDPIRLGYHSWKKHLVTPLERRLFRQSCRIVATCAAEAAWCRRWGLDNDVEVIDLKEFFRLDPTAGEGASQPVTSSSDRPLRLLYLGRRHPLKGVAFLERAVQDLRANAKVELRLVSNAFGEERERVWDWCDALVLPTLSENFGLVVAEALERGKRVITTDGAPAWEPPPSSSEKSAVGLRTDYAGRLTYLDGYREGTDEVRVQLLRTAIRHLLEA